MYECCRQENQQNEPLCERERAEEVLSIESSVASNEHANSCAHLDHENDVLDV